MVEIPQNTKSHEAGVMNHRIIGAVNLLSFTAVDYGNADPTLEEVLKYLCPQEISLQWITAMLTQH